MQNTRYAHFQGKPHNLYFSPNIIRVIKLRMRWAVHVTRMGEKRGNTRFWWRNLKETDHLEGKKGRESEDNIKISL